MAKVLKGSLAKRDDPIFKEEPSFYTRPSDRGSTPSTPSSPRPPGKDTAPESRAQVKPPSSKGSAPASE